MEKKVITVQTTISADKAKAWECWTQPEHIVNWNFASDDWCCPNAVNPLEAGEKFSWRKKLGEFQLM